jgi:hypothetical protein
VVAPPSITVMTPSPMTASANAQQFTITGVNFAPNATVKASYTGGTPVTLAASVVSATSITASITTGTTARAWSIVVTNPSGVATPAATLQVIAGPSVTSISPSPLPVSANPQTVTITGANFAAGASVKASYSSGTPVMLNITSLTATTITATFATGSAPHDWSIVVTNPSGASSSPTTLSVVAPPSIASLSPNSMTASFTAQPLTITGANFATGAVVKASYSGGAPVTLNITSANASSITTSFTPGSIARAWSIRVTNPNGQVSNAATLTVTAAAAPGNKH